MLRSETEGDPARRAKALAGLRKYQEAERAPTQPIMPAIAEARGAVLRDYGGAGAPVVFVPSLINPPSILDLSPDRSLLRWLAGQGHHVLLIDWGTPGEDRRGLSVAGHVEEILLPLLDAAGQDAALVGYCLGGTMAIAAAALRPLRALATIAAPWHFSGFPDDSREGLARLWESAAPAVAALGYLPMEVLQSLFWSLDPARTVAKFEAFADRDPDSDAARAFVTLEDWANDGPPIGAAAARDMFETLFRDDASGRGNWHVGGRAIDPAAIPCPTLHIASTVDRIVPHASAIRSGERIDLALGHVGMVVGREARQSSWAALNQILAKPG